ncbi:MAG: xanthine dehydrogenase accessory protein XdhC [Gammaproteobacteria bacterium]
MTDWLDLLKSCRDANTPCVLVTLIETEGSTPQRAGAKLVLSADATAGSVGGGDLEYQATQIARRLLTEGGKPQIHRLLPVSHQNQHCGSPATLLFEPFPRNDFNIVLFGAGHVGQALVHVLSPLPCRIAWIDARPALFPKSLPANVYASISETPEPFVGAAEPGSCYLIMTPSHDQDYRIGAAILERGDFTYLGMIGSATKRRQFEAFALARGIAPGRLAELHCPMGMAGISGRQPAVIAIAIAAEILQTRAQVRAKAG